MGSSSSSYEVRLADAKDLAALHGLAAGALIRDRFSPALLSEKLFVNPRPQLETYRVYVAVRGGRLLSMLQTVSRPSEGKAWLGIFATTEDFRRHRAASTLLKRARKDWRRERIKTVSVLGIPGNYFAPGLDPGYTAALCFLENEGFKRTGDCTNLLARVSAPFDIADDEKRLAKSGIEVRRAAASDSAGLDAFFAEQFGSDWRLEAGMAMTNDPPALHLALKAGRIVAFSAHSSQNREWGFFGPMGTLPELRGLGAGRVLLLRCLNDLLAAGHRTLVIPWVGPIAFYARNCDCFVDRVFWKLSQELGEQ